ncbi:transcription termination/antitermination protein NusA [Peptacetobacter hominis]|uniref:Transcription termination/antitermination protein NusA n=1 Tax=Peptacetobacter hominis TaxID=2743610 RepID=A0A544QTX7_9FIRM|nr:transcription termination factor NusA [Peptacetobacter hominis]TQQ84146.1 transcription termination/antitermination protein NusA [Peptacetobacter hominis]
MNHEFMDALNEIVESKGIDKDILIDTIEQALLTAYKKNFGQAQNVEVEFNRESGDIKVYSTRQVVDESDYYDSFLEIELTEARKIDPAYEIGDIIRNEVTPRDFGRIAAQTAKQVVVQRLREAEREIVYNEFIEKESELVDGEISRATPNVVYVDLGRIEGIMTRNEKIAGEIYKEGQRIKVYVVEVRKTSKGPQIIVSRSHPGLVKRLFELEVPEIEQGIVQIKSIAREAGSRTKMAVKSIDEKIDPIGACVGQKGIRVKHIVDELGDEKIDIIKYSDDPAEFISEALSPSKVVKVEVNEEEKSALVVVPDYQLSLAIGKDGQNARLAAKLTNWKIDIKSESQYEEELANGTLYAKEEKIEEEIVEDFEADEAVDLEEVAEFEAEFAENEEIEE